MIWRNSLPARVALATTALLALVMALIIGSAYATTALVLREGVDRALLAALPVRSGSAREIVSAAERIAQRFEDEDDDDHDHDRRHKERRGIQVLDTSGVVRFGSQPLPVDQEALREAQRRGVAFLSLVPGRDGWVRRSGPDLLQALVPQEDELRVVYALAGDERERVIVQMSAPLGMVSEVLPDLVKWLALLGAVGTLLCGAVAWVMAARLYRPLRAIIATAAEVSTRTPHLRIPDLWPDKTLRHLVEVLNAMISRLQEAFAAQGRFVAAAAHELRGPVAAMRTQLEVTLRRERSAEEYRAALGEALAEAEHLSDVTDHLLTLARYERGSGLVMERGVLLAPLLERAVAEARRSTGDEVVLECDPDVRLDGDPISLERLVANLVRNGLQAGGAPVLVTAAAEGDGVVITVTDRGRGIDPADLPHIFEPFYRADPARRREGGTGLGLAIVKSVVDAHGGRISVASEPGHGAVFRVWLPREASAGGASRGSPPA